MGFAEFAKAWRDTVGERANKDSFLIALCDLLELPRPSATTGDSERDTYVFERDAKIPHEGGMVTTGKIDLYKAGAFSRTTEMVSV